MLMKGNSYMRLWRTWLSWHWSCSSQSEYDLCAVLTLLLTQSSFILSKSLDQTSQLCFINKHTFIQRIVQWVSSSLAVSLITKCHRDWDPTGRQSKIDRYFHRRGRARSPPCCQISWHSITRHTSAAVYILSTLARQSRSDEYVGAQGLGKPWWYSFA